MAAIINIAIIFMCMSIYKPSETYVNQSWLILRYSIPINHSTLMINFVLSNQKHDSRVKTKSPPSSWKNITLLAILPAGDIQLNPGPSVYPCGYCEIPVTWEHKRAICCDECSIWYHSDCLDLNASELNNLQKDNVSWTCCKCDTQNAGSFTYHPYELETSNQFSALGSVSSAASMSTMPSIDSSFRPSVFSSP
jgi:hypothetical protein